MREKKEGKYTHLLVLRGRLTPQPQTDWAGTNTPASSDRFSTGEPRKERETEGGRGKSEREGKQKEKPGARDHPPQPGRKARHSDARTTFGNKGNAGPKPQLQSGLDPPARFACNLAIGYTT